MNKVSNQPKSTLISAEQLADILRVGVKDIYRFCDFFYEDPDDDWALNENEHFIYIMDGKILFFYRDRKRGAKLNYKIMKKGELFFTTYKQDHLAYFLENTHFFAFSSKKRFKFDYEKDLVRLRMDLEPKVKSIISKYHRK